MKKLSILVLLIVLFNCSGNDDGPGTTPPPPSAEPPVAATLTFPLNNQECNQGVSINAIQSSVTFTWNASAHTDSYDVVLKNLESNNTSIQSVNTNQATITILKASPYSWYVISKSNSTNQTAQSETWKFYNAGDGEQSYAPFPAELVAPSMGANLTGISSIELEWNGSDVDGDIVGYNIFFDTVTPPVSQLGTQQTGNTYTQNVTAGNVYYWRIVTVDSQQNSSESEVFEFRVD